MKKIFLLMAALILITGFVGCSSERPDKTEPVFETENISRIYFKAGPGDMVEVPGEDLADVVEWLGTFRIGEKTKEPLDPGADSVTVKIEYSDGTVVENGLSTMTVDGTRYNMTYENAPENFLNW